MNCLSYVKTDAESALGFSGVVFLFSSFPARSNECIVMGRIACMKSKSLEFEGLDMTDLHAFPLNVLYVGIELEHSGDRLQVRLLYF